MKIAIVTGASSGLGYEFVNQIPHLYKDLDEVWVIARREEVLQKLKEKSSTYIRVFAGDLKDNLVYNQVLNRLENQSPDIRMLVNSAGFGKIGNVEEIAAVDKNTQQDMIDINCRALTKMTALCLPYMSKGSRIINIASAAAFCPQAGFAVYAATKSYVLSFSRALKEELVAKDIYVTAVCPGPVDTGFFDVSGPLEIASKKAMLSQPEDVVRQALIDAKDKKVISVYGMPMKAAKVAAKLFPEQFSVRFMQKFNLIQK